MYSSLIFFIKTNASGDTLWTKTYGGAAPDGSGSVQQTPDGGYIIAGYSSSYGAGASDMYLIKTDATGDTIWTRTYGGVGGDYGNSVRQTTDNGYLIAGRTNSFGAGDYDVYLVKADSIGNLIWSKTYGGSAVERCFQMDTTDDGGCIITGYSETFGPGFLCAYLIKTDINGDTLWTRVYGDGGNDYAYEVQQTIDGGFVVLAKPGVNQGPNDNTYLIKTDALGNSGCNEFQTNTIVTSPVSLVGSGAMISSGAVVTNAATIVNNPGAAEYTLCYDSCILAIGITGIDVSLCGASDGSADLTIQTGAAPFIYLWSNGATTEDISGITAGTYSVTVTDSTSCVVVGNVLISEPVTLILTSGAYPDTVGNSVGVAWVIVSGGAPSYTYQWDDPALQTTDTAYGLLAGTYMVLVTDTNGCIDSANVTVGNFTTGLPNIKPNGNKIAIHPNPTSSTFTISGNYELPAVIELSDITGRKIMQLAINKEQLAIDVSHLSTGIYIWQVKTPDASVRGKLLKQ